MTLAFVTISCADVVPATDADANSAAVHRREASEHRREAEAYQDRSDAWGRKSHDGRSRQPQELEGYNPGAVYARLARRHEKHAREHLEAARILEEFEDNECEDFPPDIRVVCPLLGQVDVVEDLSDRVRVGLAAGVDVHTALAHMRCHLAFARTRGFAGMEACPLYLPGVRIRGVDGRRVDLIPASASDLEDLRRRTHLHVERPQRAPDARE